MAEIDAELKQALHLIDKALDRPNADPDDDMSVLARQLQRSLPWRLFYGVGLNLGQVADTLGGSIYDFSPWLTAPLIRTATETALDVKQRQRARVDELERLLTEAREELRLIRLKDTDAVYNPALRSLIDVALGISPVEAKSDV